MKTMAILGFCMILGATTGNCEVLKVHRKVTQEQKEADLKRYEERMQRAAALNNAEIARKHELQIEVEKHKVALDLEAAGASNIYVNAVASNRNEIANTNTNTNSAEV